MDDMNEGILRVTNHQTHPTNKNYKVFFFYIEEQADYFESLLKEKGIWFERDLEENRGKQMHLFGIKMTNLREVDQLNYLAIGKYRKPIFQNKYIRYGVVIFGLIIFILGIIGYLLSPVYQN
ncbi:MAG: hypothetical protein N4A35_13260 [Flavobacteriales bacterium]|jgi:hypothetical protein|nr:hypothetical protein [Flavobacteriales bacterium]